MPNLVPTLLPRLESRRFPGLEAGSKSVYPSYDGYSLANIPAGICRWLGVPPLGIESLAPEILNAFRGPFQRVILLVVDGLGLDKLTRFIQAGHSNGRYALWSQLAGQGTLVPLTSIVPSTTSSALTTLWTGRTAAEHGVIGYEMWLKEYGLNANMILHSPASFQGDVGSLRKANFDPEKFLPVPTLAPHLLAYGMKTHAFQHMAIARSGLSTMLLNQAEVVPFRTLSDLWVTLPDYLRQHAAEHSYTYIYWGELDELSHKYGPGDRRIDLEFANFTFLVNDFLEELRSFSRGDTLLLITADHGHLSTPKNPHYDLKNHPELADCLHMGPSGETRFAYLFARPGREERIQRYFDQVFPGEFVLLPSDAVRLDGLLGGGIHHPRLEERMGDFVLIAQGSAYLWWADKPNPLLGRHGGMSHTEMIIPLLGLVV